MRYELSLPTFPSTDRAVLGRSSELQEGEAETAGCFRRGDVEGWREKGVVLREPRVLRWGSGCHALLSGGLGQPTLSSWLCAAVVAVAVAAPGPCPRSLAAVSMAASRRLVQCCRPAAFQPQPATERSSNGIV